MTVVAVAITTACLFAAGVADAAALAYPTVISPDAAGLTQVTLTLAEARVVVDGAVSFNSRVWHVGGAAMFPGPTLRVAPGGTLRITLINTLSVLGNVTPTTKSQFHGANRSNIHTHGLHVDPAVDSVFRVAEPGGGTLTYELLIPSDHAPGTHWYHAHTHGASTLQIMGGLIGALIVDAKSTSNIPTEISSLSEHVVLVHRAQFAAEVANGVTTQSCNGGVAAFNPFKVWSFDEILAEAAQGGTTTFNTNAVFAGSTKNFFFTNGLYQPTFAVTVNERKVIRLIMAHGGTMGTFSFTGQSSGCTMHVIAYDGIYIKGAPRLMTEVKTVAATRVDFILTCTAAGTYDLQHVSGGVTANAIIMTVVASASARVTSASALPTTIAVTRPSYLTDFLTSTVQKTHHVHFSQGGRSNDHCYFWLGQGSDCGPITSGARNPSLTDPTCPFAEFHGSGGSNPSNYRLVSSVGDIHEWSVHGLGAEPHPLHIHVNHFQVVSFAPNDARQSMAGWAEVGDFRDTLPGLNGVFKIRFQVADFPGEVIMHCHVLMHEDHGLMSSFLVVPAGSTTASPKGSSSAAPALRVWGFATVALAVAVVTMFTS